MIQHHLLDACSAETLGLPAHASRPGRGSTDAGAPMRHTNDDHAGHARPQSAR